jgi:hypothetical protein
MTEQTGNVKVTLLPVGRRGADGGKKLWHAYYLLSEEEARTRHLDDPEDDDRRVLSYKGLKFPVGAVVEVEAKDAEANSVFPGTAKLVGRWEDEAALVRWRSYDAAWADHFEARRALDKIKRDDPLLNALAPVREAYRRLPNVQRGVLLAKVVAYIVR